MVDGGNLTVVDGRTDWHSFSYNQSTATVIKNGGSVTFEGQINHRVFLGYIDGADGLDVSFTMESGSLTCPDWLSLGFGFTGTHTATVLASVNGGTITCRRLYIDNNNQLAGKGSCVMDIAGGTVIVDGNITGDVATWEGDGRMTAYGGTGSLVVDYHLSNAGKTTITARAPASYETWAGGWGVDIGSETNDYDNDSAGNLAEYALNGDPTNSLDAGVYPVFVQAAGAFDYIHLQRNDDTNLAYLVETCTNLISGVWTNAGYAVLGTNSMGGGAYYNEVTNGIPADADESFVRLKIMNR